MIMKVQMYINSTFIKTTHQECNSACTNCTLSEIQVHSLIKDLNNYMINGDVSLTLTVYIHVYQEINLIGSSVSNW